MPSVKNAEDMEKRRCEFIEWSKEAPTTQLINDAGVIKESLNPRRGNKPYAKRQMKRYYRILDCLGTERYSVLHHLGGSRESNKAETQDLFITFTYDHSKYTIDEANARVSSDLKKMRTYIKRIFHSEFGTITSYESTESGYPAPHLIVRFDRSYPVSYRLSRRTGEHIWRLDDINLRDRVRNAWESVGGGFTDIRGIVKGPRNDVADKIEYVFKYNIKAVKEADFTSDNIITINTLANNKAFNRGTVYVSPAFKERTQNPAISRLDIIRTKLQQARYKLSAIYRKILKNSSLSSVCDPVILHLTNVINVLRSSLPPPKWKYRATLTAEEVRKRQYTIVVPI
jgi:hypothetical protein